MKHKFSLIVLLSILFVGCSQQEDEVVITNDSELYTSSHVKLLGFSISIDNHTEQEIDYYVKIDIEDDWLSKQLGQNEFVFGEGSALSEKGTIYDLKPDSSDIIGERVEFDQQVNEDRLKQSIQDNQSVKASLISINDEVLVSEYITNLTVTDEEGILKNRDHSFFILILILILLVGTSYLIDKAVRKWLGIEKPKRQDLPKAYKWLEQGANIVLNVVLFYLTIQGEIRDNGNLIMAMFIITLTFEILLNIIFLSKTKEYLVSLIHLAIIIIILAIFIETTPFFN
ncbi:hypothetical protein [Tenuibacillus multivorans]|uniref:Uncharacterized protein n=1 Tax=Tenuibacillus multivorans TaxID=237069 RepID=A0A1H0ARK4_9BACI|nr:hypothetical protein [Tenuibacillus multivorans]GEL77854.1 hypothetical protein TMU01_20890 [Tenuibacillus multivorans]SDN36001.1 hypothetical protein SAMN05216498_2041 [Tenuibacillus multivorans]